MLKYLFLVFVLGASACSTLTPRQTLPPTLLKLDKKLSVMDHLEPNLRGSQVYKEVKKDYTLKDVETVAGFGNSMAILILGFYHKYDSRIDETIKAYRQSCDMGNSLGCVNLGTVLENGFYAKNSLQMDGPDHSAAHGLYTMACDQGNALGCRLLGRQYRQTNLPITDFNTARTLYKKSCDLGNAYGCYDLGMFYHKGITVEKDKTMAMKLFQKACQATEHQASCKMLERLEWSKPREFY